MVKPPSIIDIKSIGIGFGESLLPPLTASAGKGELVAIIGRNGIGKSTLLRSITGIQHILAGEIQLFGKSLDQYSRAQISTVASFVSTEPVKVSNMSVFDLVALGRYPYTGIFGRLGEDDVEAVNAALEKVRLTALAGRYLAELSDGERQKAMIARLLAQNTAIMLMDEPSAFLDVGSRLWIMHLLYNLTRTEGKTILFTTHDLDLAVRHADKIWLMLEDGIVQGAPEDLMLSGSFGNLFHSPDVTFNADDGTWSYREPVRGSISVTAEGQAAHWTVEALKRAGFEISENADLRVEISGYRWFLLKGEERYEFSSIYELIEAVVQPYFLK